MTNLLITVAVEGVDLDPIGAKESAVMALESLGGVRVLEIDAREPEQLQFYEGAVYKPNSRRAPSALAPPDKPVAGTSNAQKPGRPRPTAMACCLSCVSYRQGPGRDEAGKDYYGTCTRTHRPVYSLRDQCGNWMVSAGARC